MTILIYSFIVQRPLAYTDSREISHKYYFVTMASFWDVTETQTWLKFNTKIYNRIICYCKTSSLFMSGRYRSLAKYLEKASGRLGWMTSKESSPYIPRVQWPIVATFSSVLYWWCFSIYNFLNDWINSLGLLYLQFPLQFLSLLYLQFYICSFLPLVRRSFSNCVEMHTY